LKVLNASVRPTLLHLRHAIFTKTRLLIKQ
jgi:hypothetical protein